MNTGRPLRRSAPRRPLRTLAQATAAVVLFAVGVVASPAGAAPAQDDVAPTSDPPVATAATAVPAPADTPPATNDPAQNDPAADPPSPYATASPTVVPGTEPSDTGPSGSGSGDAGPSSSQPLLLQQAVDKAKGEVSRLTSALTAAEQADVVAREAAAKRDGELAEEAKAEGERAKKARALAGEARTDSEKLAVRLKSADVDRVDANEGLLKTAGKLRTYSVAAFVSNSAPAGLDGISDDAELLSSRRRELLRSSGRAHVSRTKEAEMYVAAAEVQVDELANQRAGKVAEEQTQLEIESGHLGRVEALVEERAAAEQAELARRQSAAQERLTVRKDLERAGTVSERFVALALDQTTSINGEPLLAAEDLSRWFVADGRRANTTVPIEELARLFIEEGRSESIRGDIAFAQSILETGSFSYPSFGQVRGTDNNFAGIGACDSCSNGFGFPDARTGARAQMQLLKIYANPGLTSSQFANPKVRWDPEKLGVRGCCSTWKDLAGVWATNTSYFGQIQTVWNEIVTWVAKDYVAS
ncbi:MAG: glucosaminidase domain-containing protein [Candidatus Microthrix subdominans]|jgi:hypothetical protein|uniref:Glucosaminidase domain-containing protein n=1 Tax=Candidatus Neomicrothrix subdominans TaxID=2954438 RepID=A0A936NBU8_9ACTN|nr:glucosaminidase domain-containing protein [Candidatus Microthrix sp.]MBK9297440.1 glucosaminidase domain-containing protein [Candidatus Microthrix subdominans]MBK6970136.1 glucosaminidase domain-containing protein [Candidatus Microthrix sp.]MBK7166733.1 glucosaminidase domain-containing protein [Candidatus Microthrix sp.]MBK9561293.1 glucosaminidase domain-containing protein [Candidatus Microthrix sp.]MBP9066698.1 glucosaminidase domain-containing protein [Candidatus Microthrix sp.]